VFVELERITSWLKVLVVAHRLGEKKKVIFQKLTGKNIP
jgi:hypothetical protein